MPRIPRHSTSGRVQSNGLSEISEVIQRQAPVSRYAKAYHRGA